MTELYDVAIVGSGPAGLSAALLLGRSRRRVIVADHGKPRNAAARAVHGFLALDGIEPKDLRKKAVEQCEGYGVTFVNGKVAACCREELDGRSIFCLEIETVGTIRSRKLLLASGVVDELPKLEGFTDFYGATAHHCPYCDGWEHQDKRMVAYGNAKSVVELAINLLAWTEHVTCCTDGTALSQADIRRLQKYGIDHRPEKISRLTGTGSTLEKVNFSEGEPIDADALFFSAGQGQRSDLPEALGCECDEDGLVVVKGKQGTGVPGLFLAGDADGDVQFAIVAAAEGATAATAVNSELVKEDYP
jgi:thioredoxin reductase